MENQEINNAELYPSQSYREKYRATRKLIRKFNGFEMPGMYSSSRTSNDRSWFWLAMAIEFLALVLTIRGGALRGGYWFWISILTALFFIVLDLVGAWLLHHREAKKTELRNWAAIVEDSEAKQGYLNEAQKITGRQISGALLIVLSAFLKYAALFLLGSFILAILTVVAILYLIVVYVHLSHTGYYFAEVTRLAQLKNDRYKLQDDSMKNKQTELRAYHRIGSPEVFNRKLNTDKENKIEVGESFIEEMKIDKGYSYVLKVKGLLTDDMILKFIEGQDDEQVKFILTLCIKYQLTHNF